MTGAGKCADDGGVVIDGRRVKLAFVTAGYFRNHPVAKLVAGKWPVDPPATYPPSGVCLRCRRAC